MVKPSESKPSTSIEEPSYITPLEPLPKIRNFNIAKRFSFYATDSGEDTVSVHVRIKPLDHAGFVTQKLTYNDNTISIKGDKIEKEYSFTHIFPPGIDQMEIFENCAKHKLKHLFNGENSFIFTYGASNSGKTFTAHGSKDNPGLIPRCIVTIFSSIESLLDVTCLLSPDANRVILMEENEISENRALKKSILEKGAAFVSEGSKNPSFMSYNAMEELRPYTEKIALEVGGIYSMWISFYEIYNEKVHDLLSRNPRETRQLSTDKDNLPYIKDLNHIRVNTLKEAFILYTYAKYNLSISATSVNHVSSRSHSIFTITLIGRPRGNDVQYFLNSRFSICDLAGSERTIRTKNVGQRLHESKSINTSFLVLNKCLRVIRENQGRVVKKPVPCRESKLTQLLTSALTSGGTSLSLIVTVVQDDLLLRETESTLENSSVAHNIRYLPLVRTKKQDCRSHIETGSIHSISEKNVNGTKSFYPHGHEPDVYKELLDEREKNKELQELHRAEISELNKKILELEVAQKIAEDIRLQNEELEDELRGAYLGIQKKLRLLREEHEKCEETKKENLELLSKTERKVKNLEEDIRARDLIIKLKDEQIELQLKIKVELEEQIAVKQEEGIVVVSDDDSPPATNRIKKKERDTDTRRGKNAQYVLRNKNPNLLVPVVNIDTASDDEGGRVGTPKKNSSGIARSKSYEKWEDPDFLGPSAKKGRPRMRTRSRMLPDHVANPGLSGASNDPIGLPNLFVRTRKPLFHRSSPDFLTNDESRRQEMDESQVSPGTILARNLRSGRNILI